MDSSAMPEAVEAYCRGENWERVSKLLGRNGREVADEPSGWLDALPQAIVSNDPWLLLANARRLRSEGRLAEASNSYRRAESGFGPSDAGAMCRVERQALAHWLDDGAPFDRKDPFALLRAAITRDPLRAIGDAERVDTPESEVVAGLAAIAAGHVARARRDLLHAAERTDAGRYAQIVAALGAGVAGLLMGQRHATVEIEGAVASAEAAGIEWLARIGRASLALSGSEEAIREAEAVVAGATRLGDRWGEAFASLYVAWGSAVGNRPIAELDPLVNVLRSLGAGTLEAWARGLAAVAAAQDGHPEARAAAVAAESAARALGVPAARLCANLALALAAASDDEAEDYKAAAESIARETGLLLPSVSAPVEPRSPAAAHAGSNGSAGASFRLAPRRPAPPPLSIRLLGAFELELAGSPVDLSSARPRARALLRLLCLNADAAVHHESIEAALWPEAGPAAASRSLHVAVVAVRRILEPRAGRGSFQMLRRDGDAYRLALPVGAHVDLIAFERVLAAGRVARERGDDDGALRAYQDALDRYSGDVLPEDGPADWVADRRDLTRLAAVDAAQRVAEILLRLDNAEGAAQAANAGLRIDRYHDPLWRLLIRARDEAGDQGAASRARAGYNKMLTELGVEAGVGAPSPHRSS
jgi:DNA-binding SARP family transcriptional activator